MRTWRMVRGEQGDRMTRGEEEKENGERQLKTPMENISRKLNEKEEGNEEVRGD